MSKAVKKRKVAPKVDSQPPTPGSLSSDDESLSGSHSGRFSVRKETEQRRRNMMNQHFDELVMMLSMVTDRVTPKKMDKTSILEEVVRVVRQYYDLDISPTPVQEPEYKPGFFSRGEVFSFLLDALGAFLMFVSNNGRILYCSDLIITLTGHMPTRLVGQTIYDCVVPEDQAVIKSQFVPPTGVVGVKIPDSPILAYPPKTFTCSLRLYSNDPSNMTISRSFVCLSYLREWTETEPSPLVDDDSCDSNESSSCILLIGKLSGTECPRDYSVATNDVNFEFSMRVSKEGKILEVDKQASLILGFTKSDIQGASFFDYIDPYHCEKIGEAIEMFLSKGLGVSQPYRLSSKGGQYIWVVSKGFLSYNPWNHKPDHVLLQSKVLGCDEILSEYKFKIDSSKVPNPVEDYSPTPITKTPATPEEGSLTSQSLTFMKPPFVDSNQLSSSDQYPMPFSASQPLASPPVNGITDSLTGMAQLLERKNQELFELQRRMLEQQQLFEQERRQFYQVTNQVMTCIGKSEGINAQPYIDPNMSVALGTAGSQQTPLTTASGPTKMNSYPSQFEGETFKRVNTPHMFTPPFPQTQQHQTQQHPSALALYQTPHQFEASQFTSNSQTNQDQVYSTANYTIPTPNPYVAFGSMQNCVPLSYPSSSSTHLYSHPVVSPDVPSLPYACQNVPP